MSGENRCYERDGFGRRCTVEGAHTEIVNSKGQRAVAHETKASLWSTPLSGLHVVGQTEDGRQLAEPDFSELADRTGHTTAKWKQAWDTLDRKEAWPSLCHVALVGGMGDPVTVAHRVNDLVVEYEKQQAKQ